MVNVPHNESQAATINVPSRAEPALLRMKFAPTVDFVFEPAISMSVRGALTPDYDQDFGATMRDRAAMKQETLVQHHPPTPPDASELQSGLQQVAQYNADGSYSYNDPQAYGGAYTSAVQTVPNGFPHHMSHTGAHPSESFGLDISYVGIIQTRNAINLADRIAGWIFSVARQRVLLGGSVPWDRGKLGRDIVQHCNC